MRTVLDIGCATGGGIDDPPQAAKNNDSNTPTTMYAPRDLLAAVACFFHLSNGNGSRTIAKRGSEGRNRAVCF